MTFEQVLADTRMNYTFDRALSAVGSAERAEILAAAPSMVDFACMLVAACPAAGYCRGLGRRAGCGGPGSLASLVARPALGPGDGADPADR